MQLTGAEIVVECLKEQGVDTVFGYPGGTILNVYDALYKHSDEIRHILTSHEQGAAHAADGYARATGRVGVCLATSGPGATNLVTGIATAYMDSVPIVAITCNVNLPLLGKDTFQEVDIAGVTMPITKHGYIVKDVTKLADTIRKAFRIASEGRPGPVLVDITKDVTANTCEYEKKEPLPFKNPCKYTDADIDNAVALMKEAKRPFIYVGGGAVISGAYREVRELAEILDTPVCDTLMGKGVMDGHDPKYTGMIGMHGTKASNFGVSECDLLIALGARFSDRVIGNAAKFASGAKVLHIDIDAAEIDKNIKTTASVVGDLKEILTKINEKLPKQQHTEWMAHIEELKEKYPLSYDPSELSCPYIMQEIDRITKGEAIITTDVGQHQMWASQYYTYTMPRTFLSSGGLGTMGYGLPGAIGAKIGNPDTPVISISGDGGFQMNSQEIATAVLEELPIISCIFNNNNLGMVRQWQKLFYGKRYSMTCLRSGAACRGKCGEVECPTYTPDFMKLADSYGAKGIHITKTEEIEPAFREAMKSKKTPYILEFDIDPEDLVYPMVKPGGTLEELIMDC